VLAPPDLSLRSPRPTPISRPFCLSHARPSSKPKKPEPLPGACRFTSEIASSLIAAASLLLSLRELPSPVWAPVAQARENFFPLLSTVGLCRSHVSKWLGFFFFWVSFPKSTDVPPENSSRKSRLVDLHCRARQSHVSLERHLIGDRFPPPTPTSAGSGRLTFFVLPGFSLPNCRSGKADLFQPLRVLPCGDYLPVLSFKPPSLAAVLEPDDNGVPKVYFRSTFFLAWDEQGGITFPSPEARGFTFPAVAFMTNYLPRSLRKHAETTLLRAIGFFLSQRRVPLSSDPYKAFLFTLPMM